MLTCPYRAKPNGKFNKPIDCSIYSKSSVFHEWILFYHALGSLTGTLWVTMLFFLFLTNLCSLIHRCCDTIINPYNTRLAVRDFIFGCSLYSHLLSCEAKPLHKFQRATTLKGLQWQNVNNFAQWAEKCFWKLLSLSKERTHLVILNLCQSSCNAVFKSI